MEENRVSEFLDKFSRNQHSDSEHQQFVDWMRTLSADEISTLLDRYAEMNKDNESVAPLFLINKIENRLNQLEVEEVKTVSLWPKILKIAVACILLISASLFIYKHTIFTNDQFIAENVIKAGGNRAILKLADGSEIVLDTAKLGMLATEVVKTDVGQVSFKGTDEETVDPNAYHFISIPRGGQYSIVLPDGTKVWINASSSLKFPASFAVNERLVELTGEAYFEVSKDKSKPFKVKTPTQLLEVLGTHFNVNAYTDEPSVATTLMEGSVKLSALSNGKTQLLKPGQQAKLTSDFNISTVDTDIAIDWKNGNFKFAEESIATIMRKVSRWYDVDVVYQGEITDEGFVGSVPRSKNIEEVLNALKLTGLINYKISGKQVTITK